VAAVVEALTAQPTNGTNSLTSTPSFVIITGTVYTMQAQLARALARQEEPAFSKDLSEDRRETVASKGSNKENWNSVTSSSQGYVVGLDDSFALWTNCSLTAKLFVLPRGPADCVAIADEIFATAQRFAMRTI